MKQGEKLNLWIETLAEQGEGVAYFEGERIFVEGALPGEEVQALITQVHKQCAVLLPRGRAF